ncbi:Clan CA, family C1, cathepsin L-like cysteine peptidase [Tritrichomonas foetus]|uniref:Clan CA, family C1, cathepsin L-like cysteine peptidase n=4 Tax=Tritrichomonas TaxID=5723 RepID=A0A1J4KJP4_9EUKA|nr:clan CA, family C1, cathepsin L-like cysteine peptidase [Tritrichomonas foetus]OHT10052.1 Clan CA, family C1, cathepsin L-like cysteine peptidase [Tritrichomonas foetus]|eukprot:OHT10052.1 Clan CA, family C1, cathepsin L-like cysteine peptidase [Tritrichomonas foetus]
MFAVLASLASCAYYLQHEEKSFLSWMRSTNQFYTGDEYQTRFGIFMANARLVKEHNAAKGKFTTGLNKFAAMTPSEYKALLGFRMDLAQRKAVKSTKKASVESLDWREKGVVNPIKDQAQCGSCWAFSAIQAAESVNCIKSGKLERYSEQNLVDCVTACYGCNGGLMDASYEYIIDSQNGHLNLEADYPYTAVDGTCKYAQYTPVASITKYVNVNQNDEDDLAAKVETYGPVAVAIDASNWSFQLYTGGIYDEPSCSPYSLDHGVGCVGFGAEGSTKYWIVRNSWGTSWGEAGYIRMIWQDNQCGIASMACVPVA